MNFWDEEFDCDEYVYGEEPNDFLRERFDVIPKGKVLCLAEGEGRNAVFLAKQGYEVTAVDFSQVGLDKAKQLADLKGVDIHCVCADLEYFDLGEAQWEGIVSISCHLPPSLRKSLCRRVMKALKPDGVFLLEGYTPDQLNYKTGGPPSAEFMTYKSTILEELPHLEFSFIEETTRELYEGKNHFGMSAVVQAIGHLKAL